MIIYFTGTGNTGMVARRLADALGDGRTVSLDRRLTPPYKPLETVGEEERVVWLFPTYSWDIPPVVAKYIAGVDLPGGEHARHYMVTTCGDDIGLTHIRWRKAMKNRGWPAEGAYSVIMPNTYTLMKGFDTDPEQLAEEKLWAMPDRVRAIAESIKNREAGEINDVKTGKWAWIKTRIIAPWFHTFDMSAKPFRVDPEKCTRCGRCMVECPMKNISIQRSGYPKWGDNCALCLRCYHQCRLQAVEYGDETKGKGRYLCPETIKRGEDTDKRTQRQK